MEDKKPTPKKKAEPKAAERPKLCKTCVHLMHTHEHQQPKTETGMFIGTIGNWCRLHSWYIGPDEGSMAVECSTHLTDTGPEVDIHSLIDRVERIEEKSVSPILDAPEPSVELRGDSGTPGIHIDNATINMQS